MGPESPHLGRAAPVGSWPGRAGCCVQRTWPRFFLPAASPFLKPYQAKKKKRRARARTPYALCLFIETTRPPTNQTKPKHIKPSAQVDPCGLRIPHEWVSCPFAHRGERAARRDPRAVGYRSVPCAFAKQRLPCPSGDLCGDSHSLYEVRPPPAVRAVHAVLRMLCVC